MKQHGDAIESDLLRFYQIDLPATLGTKRLTWRRLGVLLNNLPRESAFVQARVGEKARWGDTEHLLASVIDVVQVGNYLTMRAHFKGDPKPPKPIDRPGGGPVSGRRAGKQSHSPAQMQKLLDNWRKGDLEMVETTAKEVT